MTVTAIIEIVAKVIGFFISLPQQGAESAKKNYHSWRVQSELKKKLRRDRADLIASVDELQSKRELSKKP